MPNPSIEAYAAVIHDPNAPLADKVDAAAALWSMSLQCQDALEDFKQVIRTYAISENKPLVVVNGNGLSQCRVVVPRPGLNLREGLTPEGERAALGDQFDALYEVRLVLRKTDPTYLAVFPPEVQAHMASVTTLTTNVPRVSIKTLPDVEEMK
jgi:hypothetical protein